MKSNKTRGLSFDEWLDTTKLRGYMDENSLEASWEAGQQSKQGEVYQLQTEIDELQKNFNNALKTIDIQQQFLDDTDEAIKIITSQVGELQKRIDDAVNCLEQNKPSLNMDYKHAINALSILKGEETK